MVNNPVGHVEKITAEVFSLDDDWEKLEKLMDRCEGLHGVGQPVASTILHLYDPERYPVFDIHALRSIRIKKKEVEGDKSFGRNMSNSAVRKPIVMTFVCEHSIGRYTNFQRAVPPPHSKP